MGLRWNEFSIAVLFLCITIATQQVGYYHAPCQRFVLRLRRFFPPTRHLPRHGGKHAVPRAVNLPRHGGKLTVPRAVSDKSVRSSDKSARRNDDAPLATDVFDEGQCDISANYKHALHHEAFVGQQYFLRAFHHGCRRSAYPRFVFSATQNPSVNPKNYDENGDFCNFPPDEPKTTMKTAFFAFSRSTLHSVSLVSKPTCPAAQPCTM